MKSQLITVRDAALACGYTPQYIRKLLQSGKLIGQKVGLTINLQSGVPSGETIDLSWFQGRRRKDLL